jgi:predicted RNA-binding protein
VRQISLKYSPDDFNILGNGYTPPEDKNILLVIPCSEGKPYSTSRTHRLVMERLAEALGEELNKVHVVTLSGLYGPVPSEYEAESAIMGYDFRLEPSNQAQISLVADRLIEYLERYIENYHTRIGYATSLAYRMTLERAVLDVPTLAVLPHKPKTRRLTEFFRRENIQELVEHTGNALWKTDKAISAEEQEVPQETNSPWRMKKSRT